MEFNKEVTSASSSGLVYVCFDSFVKPPFESATEDNYQYQIMYRQ